MASYVLVGSHDPFESTGAARLHDLAVGLADNGDDVTLFLVENAVLGCRRSSALAGPLAAVTDHVAGLADDFSLRERALAAGDLVSGVKVAGIDALVDALADGVKVVWR